MPQDQDKIEIPNNVLVHCPKVQFRLVRITACVGCQHFGGLGGDRFPDADIPFVKRYLVLLCRHDPIRREMLELDDTGDVA